MERLPDLLVPAQNINMHPVLNETLVFETSLAQLEVFNVPLVVQTFQNPEYVGSLVPTYVILLLMGVWAFYTAGGSLRNLKLCLTCKDKDFLLANHRPR